MARTEQIQTELLIKARGNLLISIHPKNRSLVLSPQRLDQFPMEKFKHLMDEYLASEVYQPLQIYEIKWETITIVAVLEDLLDLGFEVGHHNNPQVFELFKRYKIKIKSKAGRPRKYEDSKERHKVHYDKKKRERHQLLAENQQLKEALQQLKNDDLS